LEIDLIKKCVETDFNLLWKGNVTWKYLNHFYHPGKMNHSIGQVKFFYDIYK